jgi:hypothetical protein
MRQQSKFQHWQGANFSVSSKICHFVTLQKTRLFQVVPDAVQFWERALKIRRPEDVIKINPKCQNNQYFILDDEPHQVTDSIQFYRHFACKNRFNSILPTLCL